MSGAPNKRLHEDSTAHSSISRYSQHDDSGTYPSGGAKLTISATSDSHTSFDIVQDARLPKISRTESRDADRRSPLLQMYREPSSLNESHSDHTLNPEDVVRLRDSKDNKRDLKVENRDMKAEPRELFQVAKVDKDVRLSGRTADYMERKYDRDTNLDYRSQMKPDTEILNTGTSHLNWKEGKDKYRGKKYPDASGGSLDSWHSSHNNVHGPAETAKEGLNMEDKDYTEAHEAVGENKVDVRGEDRFKEKDKKRKDVKHREWGDGSKERNDSRNNLLLGNNSNELKDPTKEVREAEKWDKDRKDFVKDKDKPKEAENDHTKREPWNGTEKEVYSMKESLVVSAPVLEPENLPFERKKQKISDSWKDSDKESKDRRKEIDLDGDGEKTEKHGRVIGKESDDGGLDLEGCANRDRELMNCGVQQRKRILRPRGSPQVASREPHFRIRTQDDEGSIGNPDVSTVTYRVGECMQELTKLWKDYEPTVPDKTSESSQNGPTLEIRIAAEHVTATNRQVRGGQLWGTDIYTDDSDLVAVLMHTGYCRPTASPPPPAIQELRATVRVLPPQDSYSSTLRNNVRSRAWGAAIGCSYRVERCCIVKKGGGRIDLEPCLTHTSSVEPTLAPVVVERTMTTRAAASNALRQQRFVREVTIQYNLCNEPWIKYSISAIADKGLKKPLFTSARLKKGEVLYLESHSCRYELCFNGEKIVKATPSTHGNEMDTEKHQIHSLHMTNCERNAMDNDNMLLDIFRWSRCKKPLPQKVTRSIGIPLPLEHLEVLEDSLDWEDIQWSQTGVWISGKEYSLARVHFLSPN